MFWKKWFKRETSEERFWRLVSEANKHGHRMKKAFTSEAHDGRPIYQSACRHCGEVVMVVDRTDLVPAVYGYAHEQRCRWNPKERR
jgi:hypothetical protein